MIGKVRDAWWRYKAWICTRLGHQWLDLGVIGTTKQRGRICKRCCAMEGPECWKGVKGYQ